MHPYLAEARAYAARHPEDTSHALLLARLDPAWKPPAVTAAAAPPVNRPPLDLRAAREAMRAQQAATARRPAAASAAPHRPAPAAPPAKSRTVAPPRAAAAVTLARVPMPEPGPCALRFVASAAEGGGWRWVDTGSQTKWSRLAAGLVSAGPLQCLRLRRGRVLRPQHAGETHIRRDPGGALWADVVIADDLRDGADRVIRHELGHVADEVARLAAHPTVDAWRAEFSRPGRTAAAERFARLAEDLIEPETTAAALLARAREEQRRERRG
ncbi:hypothetical protein [Kitasatospora sp. A2-31]|uniref:hypothetical protein n=1 Tax=Kitasatospora sp. A2-31 TaxID=2916414 RepID=UPI001EECABE4|nr:hypothetical protein [Kitasatospora sp. A2-31]MCG6496626.1 hypothetical protein [Kitasatospora sp. A2-31]